ncbi:hypothetical protein [Sphingobacterium siyangense]|uniref:hypothetical protein n=1 Tax=Sphingobacterium siyangense TaxID=459529 RepID=UPI001964773F|nr:hypothetical protein [Sphingobacterium siyangense]QRY55584.1 hypothetical protein JVX97_16230 [Sphingobacterium siyangense]
MKNLIKSIFGGRRTESAPQTRLGMLAERWQHRCADWLNRKTARLSVAAIVVSMSILLMGGGTFFVFVMFRSLLYLDEAIPAKQSEGRYEVPYGSSAGISGAEFHSKEEIRLLEQYRSYVDSISLAAPDRITHDGLDAIVKNYHSQIKNK